MRSFYCIVDSGTHSMCAFLLAVETKMILQSKELRDAPSPSCHGNRAELSARNTQSSNSKILLSQHMRLYVSTV